MRPVLITVAGLGLALHVTASAFGQTGAAALDPTDLTPPGSTFCGNVRNVSPRESPRIFTGAKPS